MSISCVIVDDEPLARSLLKDYVSKVPSLKLLEMCSNPVAAMEYLKQNQVDLLFLDIQMPEITGVSLLKILKNKPLVVFTTAYSEYALESYELDVVDYLLKPITFQRFLQAVERVSTRLQSKVTDTQEKTQQPPSTQQPFIFVKDGTKLIKVRWDDILYIEGLKDYVTIHTKQQKIVSLQRLKAIEAKLSPQEFVRVHKSFIVAVKKIESISRNRIKIGETIIPVSDNFHENVYNIIEKKQL
ncbi:MAG TPA: DNA-binding response regulator [Cytophagales bacterium]|nr:DNA-binding response regulator [Cytophagales bacterium]